MVCALVLGNTHYHGEHVQHHGHGHGHGHHDHNYGHGEDELHHHDLKLRSAYIHVMAVAATSVLAIAALVGGRPYGWAWLDPVMGIVGAVLVAVWARTLMVKTGKALLDREMDAAVAEEIREVVEADGERSPTKLVDLRVCEWAGNPIPEP